MQIKTVRAALRQIDEISQRVRNERNSRLHELKITSQQAEVIRSLSQIKKATVNLNDLGSLILNQESPSRLVDSLVEDGFINRVRAESKSTKPPGKMAKIKKGKKVDRRRIILSLTSTGKELAIQIKVIDRAVSRWAAKGLSKTAVNAISRVHRALTMD